MNGLTKKEEHCRDNYHSGVRWRPGVGGWPIQNTTEWAAAAAPKTVAKAITNNYKSPTDWILFEIKVAPTEYYLLTWSAGCWASGGPPACCPPPSPRRGSLFHITTSPINSFSEISRNTIVFFSVYSCEAASLSTALLRLSPVPCPELSPHSAFQHRNNPFLILQLKTRSEMSNAGTTTNMFVPATRIHPRLWSQSECPHCS